MEGHCTYLLAVGLPGYFLFRLIYITAFGALITTCPIWTNSKQAVSGIGDAYLSLPPVGVYSLVLPNDVVEFLGETLKATDKFNFWPGLAALQRQGKLPLHTETNTLSQIPEITPLELPVLHFDAIQPTRESW